MSDLASPDCTLSPCIGGNICRVWFGQHVLLAAESSPLRWPTQGGIPHGYVGYTPDDVYIMLLKSAD